MKFEPGQIVKLLSGSEPMTVEDVVDGRVVCVWANDKRIERESFKSVVLKIYNNPFDEFAND